MVSKRGGGTSAVIVTLLVSAFGCTWILGSTGATFGAPDAATTDANGPATVTAGDEGTADMSCLARPPAGPDTAPQVDVTFIAFDKTMPTIFSVAADGSAGVTLDYFTPLRGTDIRGCFPSDPLCADAATPEVVTDDGGIAHLTVPRSFDGLYRLYRSLSLSVLYYPGRLLADESQITLFVWLITPESADSMASSVGVSWNHDANVPLGSVFVSAYDCSDRPMGGVTIALNPDAAASLYLASGSLSREATQTDGATGSRLFLDVPEGYATVSSSLAAGGAPLFQKEVYVAAATLTVADVRLRRR